MGIDVTVGWWKQSNWDGRLQANWFGSLDLLQCNGPGDFCNIDQLKSQACDNVHFHQSNINIYEIAQLICWWISNSKLQYVLWKIQVLQFWTKSLLGELKRISNKMMTLIMHIVCIHVGKGDCKFIVVWTFHEKVWRKSLM